MASRSGRVSFWHPPPLSRGPSADTRRRVSRRLRYGARPHGVALSVATDEEDAFGPSTLRLSSTSCRGNFPGEAPLASGWLRYRRSTIMMALVLAGAAAHVSGGEEAARGAARGIFPQGAEKPATQSGIINNAHPARRAWRQVNSATDKCVAEAPPPGTCKATGAAARRQRRPHRDRRRAARRRQQQPPSVTVNRRIW